MMERTRHRKSRSTSELEDTMLSNEETKADDGALCEFSNVEFSSPAQVTPMFRALAATIPSPKFSGSAMDVIYSATANNVDYAYFDKVKKVLLSCKRAKDSTRRVGNDRHLICIKDPFGVSHDLGRVVDKYSIRVL